MRGFVDNVQAWFTMPVTSKSDPIQWALILVFLLTVAVLWGRVMRLIAEAVE